MTILIGAICLAAIGAANLRWLRVAQREHYLAGSVSRFVLRWWSDRLVNRLLVIAAGIGIVLGLVLSGAVVITAAVALFGPIGLGVRGRTSKLAFTRRLKTLACLTVILEVLVIGLGALIGEAIFMAGLVAFVAPSIIDVATAILGPWEKRKAEPFVAAATKRLRSIDPTVVAITGSFGKTTTKNYVAHLLSSRSVLATPSSFNNRAGLSRSINEQLTPGTEIFIAEMGTYGPGEIAELCEFCPPKIAVVTSIGPVHLERFGDEETIVAAKSEIFERAEACVLNIDNPMLADVANQLEASGKRVWRCSAADTNADVCVSEAEHTTTIRISGTVIYEGPKIPAPPTNVACAVAVATDLGIAPELIAASVNTLPVVAHRQSVTRSDAGVFVIDDTYNANPASVRRALDQLSHVGSGRRVLVTPGMVELGKRQFAENRSFAREAKDSASDIVIVGRTNRKALLDGAEGSSIRVTIVDQLPQAVDWVRKNLGDGDAVAYVNDLPDHFS